MKKKKIQRIIDVIRNKDLKKNDPSSVLRRCGFLKQGDRWLNHERSVQFKDTPEICNIILEVFAAGQYDVIGNDTYIVFDIGMNQGVASIFFALQPNISKVVSFEPMPPTFQNAMENIRLNSLSDKIETHCIGLGKAKAEIEVVYNEKYPGRVSTSHLNKNKSTGNTQKAKIEKASEILKPYIEQADHKILMKIDTEGSEFDIIEDLDAAGLLKKISIIVMEYHFNAPDNLIQTLQKNMYLIYIKNRYFNIGTGLIFAINQVSIPE